MRDDDDDDDDEEEVVVVEEEEDDGDDIFMRIVYRQLPTSQLGADKVLGITPRLS